MPPTHSTSDGEAATHMLVIEVPLRLVENRLLDQVLVKDAITGVLSIARVAGRCGSAEITLREIGHA